MALRSLAAFLILVPLIPRLAAQSNPTPTAEPEPRYDTSTTSDMMMVVAGQREVAKGGPLTGIHLLVKLDTAKADSDPLDVYLGPAEFVKDFEMNFAKGDRIQIIGSKVKYAGNPIILAREVRRDSTTMYLRDIRGNPFWKKS